MPKLKIRAILVKDGWMIALNGSEAKPEGMTHGQFASKNEVDQTDILLALEDNILSNAKSAYTTTKELRDSLNKIYEDKYLVKKIYLT